MKDWKSTLNLPQTAFPMKANLPITEPETIALWERTGLYAALRQTRAGAPKFVLHDGPPYANGRIHIGHALNKVLKDFVVKAHSMTGEDAPYVPGWDCHGLPIEINVEKELGAATKDASPVEFRRACREYAAKFVDSQREDFVRLGVLGDWAHPYLTMDFAYQAAILRALGTFVARGLVYKGKKPVYWCLRCRTALAEAEVDYETHRSPSIYVEFPLSPDDGTLAARVPALAGHTVTVLIWTTTPWTIPANLAVAFHPDVDYAAYPVNGRLVILAEGRAQAVADDTQRALGDPVARFKGRDLEGVRFRHPLYDRSSLGVLADYVTLEQGTGAVHTAPGHGADDFATGVRYGLDIYAPIGTNGRFLPEVGVVGGLKVFEANPVVEAALAERGWLWHSSTVSHSYPHCWRCHQPVIFLATPQWFISMDGLRRAALDECQRIAWMPPWGRERMTGMFAVRPDWCISRQRVWGVPIPALACDGCGRSLLTPETIARAADVVEARGADAWYEADLADFVPPDLHCDGCGGRAFTRERDILDVWFDSGSSQAAVLARRPDLSWPADLYLEGTDQYRGWFQSSLLVALGTRDRAPYRRVLTHGFVVDEHGHKMSKSVGNTIAPQTVIAKHGADVLRLWVSMVDVRDEVGISERILDRTVEAYRKIRNTFRGLLMNLYDFHPDADAVAPADRLEIDRYILSAYGRVARRVREAYDAYDFQAVFQTVNTFMTVDLSAFYLDVSKDRLYTLRADARERRSAQTAIYLMADGLVRLLSPVLSITADEIWRHLPGPREPSVHLATFVDADNLLDEGLDAEWKGLLALRAAVNAALETARADKRIGAPLTAQVHLKLGDASHALAARHAADLAPLFIVSRVELARSTEDEAPEVEPAPGDKCPRCWRFVTDRVADGELAGLCLRCADAVGDTVAPLP